MHVSAARDKHVPAERGFTRACRSGVLREAAGRDRPGTGPRPVILLTGSDWASAFLDAFCDGRAAADRDRVDEVARFTHPDGSVTALAVGPHPQSTQGCHLVYTWDGATITHVLSVAAVSE